MAVHFNELVRRLLREEVPTDSLTFETLFDTEYLMKGIFRVSEDPRRVRKDRGVRITFMGPLTSSYEHGWGIHHNAGSLLITGFRRRIVGGPRVFLGEVYG